MNLQEGPLIRVFERMTQAAVKLDEIGSDRAKAAEYAALVLSQDGAELGASLFTTRQALRGGVSDQLRENLFNQPIKEAWGLILIETRRYLNAQWQEQVYSYYQARIDRRYPFDRNTAEDVNVSDFKDFFHPSEGILAKFRNEQLAPYMKQKLGAKVAWLIAKCKPNFQQSQRNC